MLIQIYNFETRITTILLKKSYQLELLDQPNIPQNELFQNLKELNIINTFLGGHAITISGLKSLLSDKSKKYTVADVACGGGDSLKAMAIWARKKGFDVHFIGIDLKLDCILYAQKHCLDYPEITFIHSDYKLVEQKFDIITCALFCHHLSDIEVIEYLNWCSKNANIGFVINDLHRNWLAKWSIKMITKLFSNSYLVKNDAPLSVERGFLKSEWVHFFQQFNFQQFTIKWKWAFRHLIVCKTD